MSLIKTYKLIIKVLISALVVIYLYYSFKDIEFFKLYNELKFNWIYLLFLILLMPLNWYFEFVKWKLLARKIDNASNSKLWKSLFSGISSGIVTPNRLGNFIGRIMYFNARTKIILTLGIVYSNFAQFLATINVGLISFLFALFYFGDLIAAIYRPSSFFIYFSLITVIALNLFYFFYYQLVAFLPKRLKKKNLIQYFHSKYHGIEFKILFFSFIRFGVFTLQYMLAFMALETEPELRLLIGIILTFFISTIIPSLFFGKLGVRESVAILVLSPFIDNVLLIVMASFLIWLINLVLPALIGLYFLLISNAKVE